MRLNRFAAVIVLIGVSAIALFAQAERVKGKAKDLKRDIEAKQTNRVSTATNAPSKKF
jgi:hypothetical protein